ncbi:MAG: phospho-sugar mutase [Acidimicrobiia bacterium]|nr:phospho-sugar mutase [Acidimicrobiia bacterium]
MSETTVGSDVFTTARRWIAVDRDAATRAELESLLRDQPAAVERLFAGRISFGTAGLRAALGPGPTRMNRVVVAQTTAGLARWLQQNVGFGNVVVGFDARHYSETFAQDAAAELAAAGFGAELLVGPTPTPVLAHAVLDRNAIAGIMITASHNPPADNGYKLYLSDGIQLVAPADAEIAAAINQVATEHAAVATAALQHLDVDGVEGDERERRLEPLRSSTVTELLGDELDSGSVTQLDDEPQRNHVEAAVGALLTDQRDVRVLYTAMHGVGGAHLIECFASAGFLPPEVVPEQFEPDPDFPTADFPNPEEPGALDLAYARAAAADPAPDLIIANDPDADRLAVAVPDGRGAWNRLTGDQVGFLFLDHVFRHRGDAKAPLVASSIVSSRFVDRIAEAYGAQSVRTLTGFKWVARPMVDQPDADYLMGYEEALGYCIGDRVRDKDGISAALVMAEIAAGLKAAGKNLRVRLDELAAEFGLYATSQVTVSFVGMTDREQADLKQRAATMTPGGVGGIEVVDVEHLTEGRHLPPTAGVAIDLADGSRVVIRPSGTEPKMKAYLEVIEDATADVSAARERASERMERLADGVRDLLTGSD